MISRLARLRSRSGWRGIASISDSFIGDHNAPWLEDLRSDYDHLGEQLHRRGIDVENIVQKVSSFEVAVPSWGVGTGGTRFARFPGPGEPRNVFEKIDDCATINALGRCTSAVSLHIPWDRPPGDPAELCEFAAARGITFDAMNSNTFQDQPGQDGWSYKFGSLSHTDKAVRDRAVAHNIEVIDIGVRLGSSAITVWVGDGSNFPGQTHFRGALERYIDSTRQIYAAMPGDWRLFVEHKIYEPAFYYTVICDWGTSYWCATELGERALSLVDLGHHAPTTNIECIVSRLIQFGKLGGFHFNDSKYGDDDLDSGSINPFQLFLVFNELVDAAAADPSFAPAYMLDQSHNVTDPIESLVVSAEEVQRAYAQALLVDRAALREYQHDNDAVMALRTLKRAFATDVGPLLAEARVRGGGAVDPVACFRASGYRAEKARERPSCEAGGGGGIV